MLAAIGLQACAVDGNCPDPQQPKLLRQFQNPQKTRAKCLEVLPPELANRVVIGVGVARQIAYRKVVVSSRLDAPAAEDPVAVAVDQQRQHHPRRELRTAATALV